MPTSTPRTITDAAVLAALAHRTRRRLMDVLKVHDAATVGMLAGQLDIAVGSASHHLGVLAQAELVTEAPERARDRRERWWRLVDTAVRWNRDDLDDSPATQAVALAADSLGLERQTELARRSLTALDRDAPMSLAAFSTDTWMALTPSELAQLAQDVLALLAGYRRRSAAPDEDLRQPCFVFARGFPAQP